MMVFIALLPSEMSYFVAESDENDIAAVAYI